MVFHRDAYTPELIREKSCSGYRHGGRLLDHILFETGTDASLLAET